MFQWTEKFQPQQDWITVLIIFTFIVCVHLYSRNKHQFKLLISFWKTKSYFKIYDKEKFANPLQRFNLLLTLISLITYSLLGSFFYEKLLMSLYGEFSFFTFFVVLSALVICRYGILKLIFQFSDHFELYQQTVFRSLSFYGLISIFAITFISIYFYRFFDNTGLLFIIIILILCSVYLSHLTIYLGIIRKNPKHIVYLILYICAFKIAPWLWLYKLVY